MSKRWEQLAAITGLVGVALLVTSGIVGGETPDFDAPVGEVTSFYVDEEGSQGAAAILAAYGAFFLAFFVSRVRRALRLAEGPVARLSTAALAGGVLMAVGITIFAGLGFALADAADSMEPAATQALHVLNSDMFFTLAVGSGVFLLATGLGTIRFGGLPTWLGWLALIIGILCVTPVGFFAFLAGLIWMAIASIVLCVGAEDTTAPAAGA